ncbi:uncharacterized protein METZ01_LOCUS485093, partial [marine metagenome]
VFGLCDDDFILRLCHLNTSDCCYYDPPRTLFEICRKNKHNARTAYAELNRRGIACDVASYQQLRRQKDAEWWANFRKLQRHVNCLETGIPNISINQLKTSTPYLRCADVTRCNIMAYTYQAGEFDFPVGSLFFKRI